MATTSFRDGAKRLGCLFGDAATSMPIYCPKVEATVGGGLWQLLQCPKMEVGKAWAPEWIYWWGGGGILALGSGVDLQVSGPVLGWGLCSGVGLLVSGKVLGLGLNSHMGLPVHATTFNF